MEHYKISKLLNDSAVSKFATKKWVEVSDSSSNQYSVNKNIRFRASMLRSDLCDYSDAYIVVKGPVNVRTNANTDINQKDIAFKNNTSFRSCITKINSTLIGNAEDLDTVLPMYNLLEYSQNYSMTSGSLSNYYRGKTDDVDDNASDGKSFRYKSNIIGKIEARPNQPAQTEGSADQHGNLPPRLDQPPIPPLNTEVVVRLKHLSNFWRSLHLPLINYEIELDLKWSKYCVLLEDDDNIRGVSFTITSIQFYVAVILFILSLTDFVY